jgi:hypothetical protein
MTATSPSLHVPVKLAGLLTGLLLAAALVAFMRIPQEDGRLGADVRVVAVAPEGINTTASGTLLSGRHLTSGGEAATGTLPLRNDTRGEAAISFRALAPNTPLADRMMVELSLDGDKVAGGTLTELRRWDGALRIPRGSTRTLEVSAWIPGSVRDGYEGKTADINLQIRARQVGR